MSAICPEDQDCEWAAWAEWSDCTQANGTCGTGFRERERTYKTLPRGNGRLCPPKIKKQVDAHQNCSGQLECCINQQWGEWNPFGPCSVSCGKGVRKRGRIIAVNGTACGSPAVGKSSDFEFCVNTACPVNSDCVWGGWADWSQCSKPCHGYHTKQRRVEQHGSGDGLPCIGPTKMQEQCNPVLGETDLPALCVPGAGPKDCELGVWSSWSQCSVSCGDGTMDRSRSVKFEGATGGKSCDPVLRELTSCTGPSCIPGEVDCKWADWQAWSPCHNRKHKMTRFRDIATKKSKNGNPCLGSETEIKQCGPCTSHEYFCVWSTWQDWGPCSGSCGTNTSRTRSRHLTVSVQTVQEVQQDWQLPQLQAALEQAQSQRIQGISVAFGIGALSFVVGAVVLRVARAATLSSDSTVRYDPVGLRHSRELIQMTRPFEHRDEDVQE